MKDINKMRLGVLRELKNLHKYLDNIERNVKSRNPLAVRRAYLLIVHLAREMHDGALNPDSIALDVELITKLQETYNRDE